MRRLVAITYIIMLSAALLFGSGDTLTVSASSPTQKNLQIKAKSTNPLHLSPYKSALCTGSELGYSPAALTIAKEKQKGLITDEIIEEKIGVEPLVPDVTVEEPEPLIREVAAITASISAIPTTILPESTVTPEAGSSGELQAEELFSLVNQTRVNAGLAPFEKHPDVCAVVQSRAPELDNEIYGSSYMHAGFQARFLPFHATENMISQHTEEAALNWWMNSPVHRSAILGSTKYACVACAGKSCAMIFSDLDPQ